MRMCLNAVVAAGTVREEVSGHLVMVAVHDIEAAVGAGSSRLGLGPVYGARPNIVAPLVDVPADSLLIADDAPATSWAG